MEFDQIYHLVTTYGYFFIFLLMVLEGPVTTIVCGFAAALGVFNLYIIFLLAFFGNLLMDLAYYAIGYWGRNSFIDKHKKIFGFTTEKIRKLDKISNENVVKSLFTVKLIPFFAMPGLITAGITKIRFSKYLKWVSLIIIADTLFFLLLGYYFGSTYRIYEKYFDQKYYLIGILILLLGLIIYGYKKFTGRIAKI